MKRMNVGGVSWVVCMTVGSAAALASSGTSPLGRWNLTIVGDDDVICSWMNIHQENGKDLVKFMSEVGGQYDDGEVTLDGNTISFKSIAADLKDEPKPWYTYTGTIDGETMSGTRSAKGKTQKWTAKRMVPLVNLDGTWKIASKREGAAPMTLEFTHKGDQLSGQIHARADRPLSDVKLTGDALTFTTGTGERAAQYEVKVKGDVLEGTVRRGSRSPAPFLAQRDRTWGEPVELFNGKDLSGWKPLKGIYPSKWMVTDGIMMTPDRGANIVTDKKFKDFKLHVEFRVPQHGNSGVYLRGRYEVQVEDSYGHPPQAGGCGAVYSRIVPSTNASKPAGEWQTYDVTLVGQYLTLLFNDVKVIDNTEIEGMTGGALDNHDDEPGPIYLQGDHGKIEYRKITLTPAVEP